MVYTMSVFELNDVIPADCGMTILGIVTLVHF